MGIAGLLPALRAATRRVHVREYAGKTVAVDAYSWLHRGISAAGAAAAADLLAGCEPQAPVDYCMSRVNQLRAHSVEPLLVFDGAPLPMKAGREAQRASARKAAKERAHALHVAGDAAGAVSQALRAVDVSPLMAARLIGALRRAAVRYVVAPYEADAQMAFLARTNAVAAIITEDSDLLLFGAARVLYKLDAAGYADEVVLSRVLDAERTVRSDELTAESSGSNDATPSLSPPPLAATAPGQLDLSRLTFEQFRHMCILSGCDYLHSVSGVGLRTAHRLVVRGGGSLDRVLAALRRDMGTRVPADYTDAFVRAELTFLHQRVWDAVSQRLVFLTPLEDNPLSSAQEDDDPLSFVGPLLPDALACAIASGDVCPVSHVRYTHADIYGPSAKHSAALGRPPAVSSLPFELATDKVPTTNGWARPRVLSRSFSRALSTAPGGNVASQLAAAPRCAFQGLARSGVRCVCATCSSSVKPVQKSGSASVLAPETPPPTAKRPFLGLGVNRDSRLTSRHSACASISSVSIGNAHLDSRVALDGVKDDQSPADVAIETALPTEYDGTGEDSLANQSLAFVSCPKEQNTASVASQTACLPTAEPVLLPAEKSGTHSLRQMLQSQGSVDENRPASQGLVPAYSSQTIAHDPSYADLAAYVSIGLRTRAAAVNSAGEKRETRAGHTSILAAMRTAARAAKADVQGPQPAQPVPSPQYPRGQQSILRYARPL